MWTDSVPSPGVVPDYRDTGSVGLMSGLLPPSLSSTDYTTQLITGGGFRYKWVLEFYTRTNLYPRFQERVTAFRSLCLVSVFSSFRPNNECLIIRLYFFSSDPGCHSVRGFRVLSTSPTYLREDVHGVQCNVDSPGFL